MNRPHQRCLSVLGWTAALLLTACHHGNKVAIGSVHTTLAAAPAVTQLELQMGSGSIRVEAASGDAVEIRAEVLQSVGIDDLAIATPEIELPFKDHVEVVRKGSSLAISSKHDTQPDHNDWQLNLVVMVPSQIAAQIDLGAGQVTLDLPQTRDLAVKVGAGKIDINATQVDGRIAAQTGVGQVAVAVTRTGPTGGIELSTGTGEVRATLPPKLRGSFELDASVGDVSVAKRYGLEVRRSGTSASARGSVDETQAHHVLRTSVGNVSLR